MLKSRGQRDHETTFCLGLGITVIDLDLAIGRTEYWSVSCVLVSWSQVSHLFLKCDDF